MEIHIAVLNYFAQTKNVDWNMNKFINDHLDLGDVNTARNTLVQLNEINKNDPIPPPIPPPLPIASPPLPITPLSEPSVAAPPSEFSVALSAVSSSEEQTIRDIPHVIFNSDDMYVVTASVQIEYLTNKTIKISGDLPLFNLNKYTQGKIVKNKWGKMFELEFSFSSEVNIEGTTVKLEEDTS
ncbi:9374_t:CDS:2 [Gigaspora margarita]|uniref:9374_t:CDS:1 n=1 Tax=Gigaspora margarita TaxID=4874 RepID=A0ABN7UZ78_GIGMA|nr:9374_t:CDS:2 [Gigaspora margarita]